jgi:hypothetical protein
VVRRTKALVKCSQGRRGSLAFGNYLTNFEQGGSLDRIFTPVNGEFELLGKFGRCFIMTVDRLRSSNNSSINRELNSSVRNC